MQWCDVPFEALLDAGAEDHVCETSDAPGYGTEESDGSRQGKCFLAANGERIPNRGQLRLNLMSGDVPVASTFRVARVTRPLFSVAKMADAGFKVTFDKTQAEVTDVRTNRAVARFPRRGGLYVSQMVLRAPESESQEAELQQQHFHRQGRKH